MVTHQPKDGHPPEGSMLQTRNLALKLISQNYDQVTIAMDGHLLFQGWLPTILRMVAHHPKDGHPREGSELLTWDGQPPS